MTDRDWSGLEKKPEPAPGQGQATVEGLIERLNTLEERLHQSALTAGQTHGGGGYQQPQTPQEPEMDMAGLPDPVADPAKYNAELAKRIQKHTRALREYDRELASQRDKRQEQSSGNISAPGRWNEPSI
jgi:hypothetical protein